MELRRLNDGLAFVERHFIDPRGLALRPWFKHLIVAPGLHTGYAANVYPGIIALHNCYVSMRRMIMMPANGLLGIADALTDSKEADDVQAEIVRVALRIREAAAHMARHL